MDKAEQLLNEIKNDLSLTQQGLEEWNADYFDSHKKRYQSDFEMFVRFYNRGEILEVGSAPCHFTYLLKKLNYPVVGLDIEPGRLNKFIKKYDLDVRKCDIEKEQLPFKDNQFNFIIFSEIFEHLRIDPIFTMKEIRRVLKPDGIMMLTTPNLYALERIISFATGRGLFKPYKQFEKLHTIGHMGHIREYSTDEAKHFLENTGFKVIDTQYRIYNKTKKKIIGPIMDLFCRVIPRVRPAQVIICQKYE